MKVEEFSQVFGIGLDELKTYLEQTEYDEEVDMNEVISSNHEGFMQAFFEEAEDSKSILWLVNDLLDLEAVQLLRQQWITSVNELCGVLRTEKGSVLIAEMLGVDEAKAEAIGNAGLDLLGEVQQKVLEEEPQLNPLGLRFEKDNIDTENNENRPSNEGEAERSNIE